MMGFFYFLLLSGGRRRLNRAARLCGWLIACAASAGPAAAQLGLPGGGAGVQGLGNLRGIGGGLGGQLGSQVRQQPALRQIDSVVTAVPLRELRRRTIDELLNGHRDVVEPDPAGEPVVRGELLLLAPTDPQLAAAQAEGFVVLRQQLLPGLELRHVVLQPPAWLSTSDALTRLRAIDPQIEADFNHVYTRSGSIEPAPLVAPKLLRRTRPGGPVGLIDGGIDTDHPALRGVERRLWGCNGKSVSSEHGTAVASLLVGRDGVFAGVVPDATLFAADIYCGRPSGGSAEAVASALGWMAEQRVAVVNVSLVGPANKLLERAVRAFTERGHLVVAAVGNDGPTAPSLYPAAYPDVVGVTGVDRRRVVLPEAGQGSQVVLAAPGADIAVAQALRGDYVSARGTSFAAPLVAGLLAADLLEPDKAAAARALTALLARAIDLGASGRDPVYGFGLVAEQSRLDPRRLQLRLGRSP